MKKIMMILMIAIGVSSVAFGQTKMSKDSKVETQIIALEKQGWEAWKNKNAAWFQTNLAEDALQVNGGGVLNKSQIVKITGTDCEIKSFSLDNFKFLMLDKNSALITFTGMQDGVCSGKTIPAKVHSTSVYVKRGGKWLNALYTETPTVQ
ncbi:MAG: nuclear transport factor 2 family protein [Pyrinomonadaceae bacterium]|nr:nuclear transport factor 2 family protein [Pyrinomonadaceae bacterium]